MIDPASRPTEEIGHNQSDAFTTGNLPPLLTALVFRLFRGKLRSSRCGTRARQDKRQIEPGGASGAGSKDAPLGMACDDPTERRE